MDPKDDYVQRLIDRLRERTRGHGAYGESEWYEPPEQDVAAADMLQVLLEENAALRRNNERMGEELMGDDVCCCGESMAHHSSPLACGHSPVSMRAHAEFQREQEVARLQQRIAELEADLELARRPAFVV